MRTSIQPRWFPAGDTKAVLQRPKKNRFVNRPISFNRPSATYALTRPMKMASPEIVSTRGVQVKSPSLVFIFNRRGTRWIPERLLKQDPPFLFIYGPPPRV